MHTISAATEKMLHQETHQGPSTMEVDDLHTDFFLNVGLMVELQPLVKPLDPIF